jgi:glycosyltransferase involved in cell wall biosynthesis
MAAKKPRVSVLMPVRNEEKNISSSIGSVLSQTMEDWELIVADNGSSDRSWDLAMEFRKTDERIKVFRNRNLGFTHSLNLLIGLAQGRYLARLDADDEFLPEKLAEQCSLLDDNTETLMVAGRCSITDESGTQLYEHGPPATAEETRWSIIFRNEFWHSSVMWRGDSNMRYDESFVYAQDYELWSRMAKSHDIRSIQKTVAKITRRTNSITSRKSEEQKSFAAKVSKRNMEHYLGREISMESAEGVRNLHLYGIQEETAETTYEELKNAFREKRGRA